MYTMNLRRATASPWRTGSASLLQKRQLVDRQTGREAEGLGCHLWALGPCLTAGWVSRPGRAGWVRAPTYVQPARSRSGRPASAGVLPSLLPWQRCSRAAQPRAALGEAALQYRRAHEPAWQGERGLNEVPALKRGPQKGRPFARARAVRGAKGTRWRSRPRRHGSGRVGRCSGRCLLGQPWL